MCQSLIRFINQQTAYDYLLTQQNDDYWITKQSNDWQTDSVHNGVKWRLKTFYYCEQYNDPIIRVIL